MKTVYEYSNYRKFMKDFYKFMKKKRKQEKLKLYTYLEFSEKAGMTSNSYIIEIIRGTKKLSLNSMFRVATAMGLKGNEIGYFASLISHNDTDTKNRKQRKYHKETMDYYRNKQ